MTTIHPSADVAPSARLGENVRVWQQAQVRDGARIGDNCNIGKGAYVGLDVEIGANCKIHNYALVHEGIVIEGGVFVGPHVCFANDRYPRAINPDGSLKTAAEWEMAGSIVEYGASIGARSVILPGVRIGRFALVAAGSVVTHDVPPYGLVRGNPARLVGHVCACGKPSHDARPTPSDPTATICAECAEATLVGRGTSQ